MTNIDELLERNKAFARTDAKDKVPAIPFVPNMQTFVITCIDPRVDPASILGLELGDAIVDRNVGGRITPAVIQDVAWISYLHEVKAPDADWFELAIIHHTDCGSGFFADPELRHGFAKRGFDEDTLAELPVLHPAETVRGRRTAQQRAFRLTPHQDLRIQLRRRHRPPHHRRRAPITRQRLGALILVRGYGWTRCSGRAPTGAKWRARS